jgi:outer membrane protein assembly factor BamB
MKPRFIAGCILSLVLLTYGCDETVQVNSITQATPSVISTQAQEHVTASTTAVAPLASPDLRWKVKLLSDHLWAAPAIADGVAYILGEYNLFAVDAQSGTLLWQFDHRVDMFGSTTPLVNDGTIYFTIPINSDFSSRTSAEVYAVDIKTHEERWRRSLAEEDVTNPVLLGDTLFFAGRGLALPDKPQGSHIYAVDAASGVVKWRISTVEKVESVFAGKTSVYFGDSDTYVYGLDAATGLEKWKSKLDKFQSSVLAVTDEAVYALSSDTTSLDNRNRLYALDSATGKQKWVYEKSDSRLEKLAVINKDIYLTTQPILVNCFTDPNCLNSETHKGSIAIIDTDTGKEKSLFRLAGYAIGIPVVGDRSLYVQVGVLTPRGNMFDDHYIMAIDINSGQEIWRYFTGENTPTSQPVLNGDPLYFWESGEFQALRVP